ncbi:MAG: hypothetical protein RL113_919 [Pseudomonadota bacterium]
MLYMLYQRVILRYPLIILMLLISGIVLFSATNLSKLEIDASAETLLLNDDKDLAFTRTMNERFEGDDLLILAYQPNTDLLSRKSIQTLKEITQELEALPEVTSVDSIINVPLFFSPVREIDEVIRETRTLQSPDINLTQAKQEFLTSPLYKDSLVNKDFTISSIVIHLKEDKLYKELLKKRNTLLQQKRETSLTLQEAKRLNKATKAFKAHRDEQRLRDSQNIEAIRSIVKTYQDRATFFLGGVQMISNDIVGFVKSDLVIYGSMLVVILMIVLGIIFKRVRWIVLPVLVCTVSVLAITSSLGLFGWEITVISSNFIALQLIITISIVLHLIVRYDELIRAYPRASNKRIILLTILSKATPTFFAILTTIAGFSTLLYSHIHPVINLGWMMSAGISFSLVISFIIFPTLVLLLPKTIAIQKEKLHFSIPSLASKIVVHHRSSIFVVTFLVIIFSITGARQLIVENSFINYFKKNTAIYQGMKIIDQELGGTTPLDIILTLSDKPNTITSTPTEAPEEDSFEDEFSAQGEEEHYWFTDSKIELIQKVHHYLTSLEEIGEVQSFDTLLETGKILNQNKPLDSIDLALIYKKLPQKYRDTILTPYVNIEHNQLRFSTRIKDSNDKLRRDALLKKIERDLTQMIDPDVATVRLSNLMVLYNNMLQSLFHSQISMIGLVLLIITIMFLILFRTLKLTLIALTVNIIPIAMIFGFMGWFNIPLDIMTITIAAIAMGIGIDDTIHYMHRFEVEFSKDKDYYLSMHRSHASIGNAMYFTTLVIVLGFSILMLSNLIPTIYFGLLTMLVMVAALVSDLILLPTLLLMMKPYRS